MMTQALDRLAPLTADLVSRRNSLLVLGGTALGAAVAAPAIADAGKAGKKASKKCKKQGGQCRAYTTDRCMKFAIDPEACQAAVAPCCKLLEDCKAGAALECVFGVF